jgi:ATP-binding cassette subfamily B multidrug efflux pump
MSNENNNARPRRGGPMGGGPQMGGEKAKDFKGSISKLAKHLSKYKTLFLLVLIFAIGSTLFSIIGPKILGNVITEIFEGLVGKIYGTGGIDFDAISKTLIMLFGFYGISGVFSYVQGFIMTHISQKITYGLRKEISKKINRMPMNYFETKTHGEVLSRVTNDVDTLGQSLNQSITQIITAATTVIGVSYMMLSISGTMTLVAVLTLPLSMGLMFGIMGKSQKHFKNQQEYLGHVNGQVEEVYGGHNVVRVFNGEEKVIKEFSKANESLYESGWKSQFLSGIIMPIMMFVGNIGYVVVSILGGYLVVKERIKVGDIQSFITYVRTFNQQISQLAQVSNQLQQTAAAAERVFEFLEEVEEDQFATNPVSPAGIESKVEFNHVKFGYKPDKVIINDFSASVNPGQKIAIVGPTGAGKTTIVKLLMRFYDVNEGEILIDGHNIKDFNRGDLRSLFGMVLQDTWLFNGSIMDNIRYGKEDATDEEVIAAAKAAHAHHFISTLPDGYNLVLNEEASNVSQGQKQLLTIARAILANPKILILDEATSSVDTRTEIRIQKAMDNLMHGRTSFVIAHRLSTIKDADLILVMKDGDIVEQGNHEELLKENGFYASLYNSQFEHSA